MATTFYTQFALSDVDPNNIALEEDLALLLTRDTAGLSTGSGNTVGGPTAGVQIANVAATAHPSIWISKPLNAVTISGTVTFNFWMSESNMSANVGAQAIVYRCDSLGVIQSTIINSEKGVELPVTTRAAQNWTAAPTSTAIGSGERIAIRVFGNDVGTMGSGFSFDYSQGAASGGVDGDSFVTFTETISEFTATPFVPLPHPHIIYLRQNR